MKLRRISYSFLEACQKLINISRYRVSNHVILVIRCPAHIKYTQFQAVYILFSKRNIQVLEKPLTKFVTVESDTDHTWLNCDIITHLEPELQISSSFENLILLPFRINQGKTLTARRNYRRQGPKLNMSQGYQQIDFVAIDVFCNWNPEFACEIVPPSR